MPQIIPLKDLRNTSKITELCHETKEPIFVTKNGYGDLVVMSMETYERIISTKQADAAIAQSEKELKTGGRCLEAETALIALRRKHFDNV